MRTIRVATMTRITAGEIEQVAQQHAAQMAAKRKQRSSWTPTGRASEEAIVEVELARRGLSDVSALGEFPGLGRVDISGNCLADLSGLSRCVELRWVKASANRLASTAGVGDATKLKALLLDHNIISELGAVSQLSALQTLDLSHNPLASPVEGLASLRGLATLVLSNCGLSSLPCKCQPTVV
jgi:Leucine-rich repeat (LRR) protein